jgi:hypothetical protein
MNDRTDWGLLSNHLNNLISQLDDDAAVYLGREQVVRWPVPSETERKEIEDWRKEIGEAVKSLEGFGENQANTLVRHWEEEHLWNQIADDYYSREAVSAIPQIVERFRRLVPVLVGKIPSKEVSVYLREASRCYIYGFFQASIALSRAALEAGLNEYFRRKLGSVPHIELANKIDQAGRWRLIGGEYTSMAHEVRRIASRVLHQQPVKENPAFDTLVKTRGVLKELFET